MQHVMFDIDGTLVESYDMDSACFTDAVTDITGINIDTDWARYKHVTDVGILKEFFSDRGIDETASLTQRIKAAFIANLKAELIKHPMSEIPGASAFIATLKALDNFVISFATGGWLESAMLKLRSAGIDFSDIPIASSNNHYSRVEIMKRAEQMATNDVNLSFTYFGDGSWDKKACKELGVNFVLVGDKVEHDQSVRDFADQRQALSYIT